MSDSDGDNDLLSYQPFSATSTHKRATETARTAQQTQHRDDSSSSSSSDDDLEEPYTQNLDFLGKIDTGEDDDDDDGILPLGQDDDRAKEPLRPGDVISYFHPMFVAGDRRGDREATVLATDPSGKVKIVLDNAECLPSDWQVKRIKVRTRKNTLEDHPGVYRPIDGFKLTKLKLSENSTLRDAVEKESDRMGDIMQRNFTKCQAKIAESGCGPIDVFQSLKGTKQKSSRRNQNETSRNKKRRKTAETVDLSKSSSSSDSDDSENSDSSSSMNFPMINKKRREPCQKNKTRTGSQSHVARTKQRKDKWDDDSLIDSPRDEAKNASSARRGSLRRKERKTTRSSRDHRVDLSSSSSSSDSERDRDVVQKRRFPEQSRAGTAAKINESSRTTKPRNRLYPAPSSGAFSANSSDSECSGMSFGTTDRQEPAKKALSHLPTPLNIQTVKKKKSLRTERVASSPSKENRYRNERYSHRHKATSPLSSPRRNEFEPYTSSTRAAGPRNEPSHRRSEFLSDSDSTLSPTREPRHTEVATTSAKESRRHNERYSRKSNPTSPLSSPRHNERELHTASTRAADPRRRFELPSDLDSTQSPARESRCTNEQKSLKNRTPSPTVERLRRRNEVQLLSDSSDSSFSKPRRLDERKSQAGRTARRQLSESRHAELDSPTAEPSSAMKGARGLSLSKARVKKTLKRSTRFPRVSLGDGEDDEDRASAFDEQRPLSWFSDNEDSKKATESPKKFSIRGSDWDSDEELPARTGKNSAQDRQSARNKHGSSRPSDRPSSTTVSCGASNHASSRPPTSSASNVPRGKKSRSKSRRQKTSTQASMQFESDSDGVVDLTPDNEILQGRKPCVSTKRRKLSVEESRVGRSKRKDRVDVPGVSKQRTRKYSEEAKENYERNISKNRPGSSTRKCGKKGSKRSICELESDGESGGELVDSDVGEDTANKKPTLRLGRNRGPPHPRYQQDSSFELDQDWKTPTRGVVGATGARSGSSRKRSRVYGRRSNTSSSGSKNCTPRSRCGKPGVVVVPGSTFCLNDRSS